MPIGGGNTGSATFTDYVGYCSQDDLVSRIGNNNLSQLTNDVANAQTPDPEIVGFLINKADRYIDNELNGIYDVPFDSTPDSPATIRQLSIDLTCYFAMERRFPTIGITDEWKATKGKADELLGKLSSLDNVLEEVTPATAASTMTPPTTDPIVDFNDTDNIMSLF